MKKKLLLFILGLTFSASCNRTEINKQDKEKLDPKQRWERKVENVVKNISGKQIIIPDSVQYISNFKKGQINPNNKVKIATYIDSTCSVCLHALIFWEKFINELEATGQKCEFLIYIYGDDIQKIQNLMVKTGFNRPWIFDAKNRYITANNFFDDRIQTVILNSQDEVILIGDIVNRPQLEALYKKVISENQ